LGAKSLLSSFLPTIFDYIHQHLHFTTLTRPFFKPLRG
jgi:hypothetical protein